MAKLYYRYGTVGSAKTMNLLAVAHNYKTQEKNCLLLKPALDTRFGEGVITSRAGLSMAADYLLNEKTIFMHQGTIVGGYDVPYENDTIHLDQHGKVHCIVVDEAQFLAERIIDSLHLLTIKLEIPVILYGLKNDFRGRLFPGSQRIIELADSIEEIKTTCFYCNKKATSNLKIVSGKPITTGKSIELGADEMYKPTCKYCYFQITQKKTTDIYTETKH